mmetsp:Transcript_18751/g.28919  ORF Transcript_18751/g.28919 Transcript_18751/m.28919 type:complete len:170 (+) Transcript_18751:256-765(+)|eukprot:CAMPEP_0195297376 /NCGR_PEP_ID=MMETSP0707-20130614/21382_1 /TAXON_ID=33640 /ORGANISM="Asterionellopsis glacialis, Strain CCMP134" /LENGTH=169 /DNA_ID=CAMNT_0040359167 /DNA_START=246 /DNA_END=755 /DNA_ORIENTATION=+
MLTPKDLFSILVVGAFWGCTNPFLRRGAATATAGVDKDDKDDSPNTTKKETKNQEHTKSTTSSSSLGSTVLSSLQKFRRWEVWVPYLFNQCGSLFFYYLLANSNLTVAVPVCNALSLVFSIVTSFYLGERVDKPLRAIFGATLVTGGVAICVAASSSSSSTTTTTNEER